MPQWLKTACNSNAARRLDLILGAAVIRAGHYAITTVVVVAAAATTTRPNLP